jgi:hypothetical protein
MSEPLVFISYSHVDKRWKDRLEAHLRLLQFEGVLEIWTDRQIGPGQDWYQKIEDAMYRASAAVLLVSANSLTSKFILREEVATLLQRRNREGLPIYPVIVRPCAWQQVAWLARMQCRPTDGRPLSCGTDHQINSDLADIAGEVAGILKPVPSTLPADGRIGPQPGTPGR